MLIDNNLEDENNNSKTHEKNFLLQINSKNCMYFKKYDIFF